MIFLQGILKIIYQNLKLVDKNLNPHGNYLTSYLAFLLHVTIDIKCLNLAFIVYSQVMGFFQLSEIEMDAVF